MAEKAESHSVRSLVLGGIKGKPVRFSYLNVAKPRTNVNNGKLEYSTTILIPKTNTEDIQKVRDAIEEGKEELWLSKGKKVPPKFWDPLKDGDEDTNNKGEPFGEECHGMMVLNCKRGADQTAPGILDSRGQKMLDTAEFKSGDWGAVCVDIYTYVKGDTGAGAGLQHVMKLRDGEPLGNSISAERAFEGIEADEEEF